MYFYTYIYSVLIYVPGYGEYSLDPPAAPVHHRATQLANAQLLVLPNMCLYVLMYVCVYIYIYAYVCVHVSERG